MNFDEKLEIILDKCQILKNESMKKHTSLKIGGTADYFISINDENELLNLLKLCKEFKKKYFIIGNGTNILVTDKGFRGVVIKLKFENVNIKISENEGIIEVGSGYSLIKLSKLALENELEGLEFACGIPGTIGGAIRMNAGAYGSEIKDILISTRFIDTEDEKIKELPLELHQFSYRNSIFAQKPYIILSTKIKLKKGSKLQIKSKMDQNFESRKLKQPIEYPSAGSTFKRQEGIVTAKLIDELGLKGYSIGDAQVSTKHAGFLINKGNANFEDMNELIEKVKEKIYNRYKIKIELEILIVGER